MSHTSGARRRVGEILRGQTPLLLMVAAVALGLLGEGASKIIDGLLVADGSFLRGAITVGAGLILLLGAAYSGDLWDRVRHLFARAESSPPSMQFTDEVRRRLGLVVLVSSGPDPPAAGAIAYHCEDNTLTHCWLVTGPGEGNFSSEKNAESLKALWEPKGVHVETIELRNAFDAEEAFLKTQVVYEVAQTVHGLTVEDLIADFTGGTKPMTMGLVLATVERGIDLQYMQAVQTDERGRALVGTRSYPRMIDVGFKEPHSADGPRPRPGTESVET